MSDSVQPHRWQPTRLRRPWDSPGKSTGVGCHLLLQFVKVKSLSRVQLLATPCTAAHQAPPSLGFSRQEHRSGLPFPSPLSYYNWKQNLLLKKKKDNNFSTRQKILKENISRSYFLTDKHYSCLYPDHTFIDRVYKIIHICLYPSHRAA